jgi:hypothetical protein
VNVPPTSTPKRYVMLISSMLANPAVTRTDYSRLTQIDYDLAH